MLFTGLETEDIYGAQPFNMFILLQFSMARAFDDFGNMVTADYRVCKRYINVLSQ